MIGPFVLAIVLAQGVPPPPVPPQQPAAAAMKQTPEEPWPPEGVSRIGNGVTTPRLIYEVKPLYTGDAKRAGIHGIVRMEVVVEPDGRVGKVRVTGSLDTIYGLDDEAVKTVKKWRFVAGMKDGVAVPVLVEIEMTFTLR